MGEYEDRVSHCHWELEGREIQGVSGSDRIGARQQPIVVVTRIHRRGSQNVFYREATLENDVKYRWNLPASISMKEFVTQSLISMEIKWLPRGNNSYLTVHSDHLIGVGHLVLLFGRHWALDQYSIEVRYSNTSHLATLLDLRSSCQHPFLTSAFSFSLSPLPPRYRPYLSPFLSFSFLLPGCSPRTVASSWPRLPQPRSMVMGAERGGNKYRYVCMCKATGVHMLGVSRLH